MKYAMAMMGLSAAAGVAMARPEVEPVVIAGSAHQIGEAQPTQRAILYQNVPQGAESVFTTGASPRTSGGDDVTFSASNVKLTSFRFGFMNTGTQTAFDARIKMWDTIDGSGNFTGALLADIIVNFTGVSPVGAYISNPIDLTFLAGGGVSVPDNNMAFQIAFLQPGTNTLVSGNSVTYIFDGTGVNVGFSDDVYWRDINNNQVITGDEARSFGGGTTLANMVLEFEGVIIPAPAPAGLLALSGVLAARRRRG